MRTSPTTFQIRPAAERGTTEFGWLHSRHAFSFGNYYDPANMGYRTLRVLNDDVVEPGGGFGEHGHNNMEIISWVLEGALAHRDSTGAGGVIKPGDLQVMTAGSGIRHSEMNASQIEPVHFLQIWIEPSARGLAPSYEQRHFPTEGRRGRWQLVASPDGRDGSMIIHQDATLRIADLASQHRLELDLPPHRHGYLHVASGSVRLGDGTLQGGDAVRFSGEAPAVEGIDGAQLLLFDLL